jgi:hypothetical protein
MSRGLDAERSSLQTKVASQRGKLRTIAEFLVVGICTVAFALNAAGILTTLITDDYARTRDFICYWASGHQLAQHANPYDGHAIFLLEHPDGAPAGLPPLLMRNPPPALLLVLPLGLLGVRAASLLWSLLMLISLVLSVSIIAAMHGRSKSKVNILAYTFAPALCCLIAGQLAIFVLLGLVLFLRFQQTRPFLAGASLWLCALKPHLFLPFGVVLLVWIVAGRRYRVLLGAVAAIGLSTATVYILDPSAWAQYAQGMKAEEIQTQAIPCVSAILRLIVSPGSMWLQFLPAALGCVWGLAYWQRHRAHWDWMEHGSLLMIVSLVVAPYSWGLDQTVLLPALLHGLYRSRSRDLAMVLAFLSATIAFGNFLGVPIRSVAFYVWTAPVWLVWYLFAVHRAGSAEESSGTGHGVTPVSGNA